MQGRSRAEGLPSCVKWLESVLPIIGPKEAHPGSILWRNFMWRCYQERQCKVWMTFLWHHCIANIHQHSWSFFTGSQTFLHKPLICMLSGTLMSMMKKCSTKCTWYIYFLSVSQNFRLSYILFFTDVVRLIVNSHLYPCITGMWW